MTCKKTVTKFTLGTGLIWTNSSKNSPLKKSCLHNLSNYHTGYSRKMHEVLHINIKLFIIKSKL